MLGDGNASKPGVLLMVPVGSEFGAAKYSGSCLLLRWTKMRMCRPGLLTLLLMEETIVCLVCLTSQGIER